MNESEFPINATKIPINATRILINSIRFWLIQPEYLVENERTRNFSQCGSTESCHSQSIKNPSKSGLLKCLLPLNLLTKMLPLEVTKYVPYEMGCKLLGDLEDMLGGPSVFEPFLKSYFLKFAFQSINTQDWINYLYQYLGQNFPDKRKVLDNVAWYPWFYHIPSLCTLPEITTLEKYYFKLAEEWVKWEVGEHSTTLSGRKFYCDIERKIFLYYLYDFHEKLTVEKLRIISTRYHFTQRNAEIQFRWLLLCIKVRWDYQVSPAIEFAIQFCSPKYACPIFQHLCEWEEMRVGAIDLYNSYKEKIVDETLEKLLNLAASFSSQIYNYLVNN